MDQYSPLVSRPISDGTDLKRPDNQSRVRVTPGSPALEVMTDLTTVDAACIDRHTSMDMANQTMIRLGVRLLFVTSGDNRLAGLITATDLLGEKPMRIVQERGLKHDEISVDDLMTPLQQLEALSFDEVSHAQVGHIVASLSRAGRQHTLVTELVDGRQLVRGIFSTSHIARQLGMPINTVYSARTFSDLVTELT